MTDRELLELAAKAAGYTLTWGEKYMVGDDEVDCTDMPYIKSGEPDVGDAYWDPLTEDDGDALRLAVKLGIGVKYHRNAPPELGLPRECAVATDGTGRWFAEAAINGDENAATRRAIVRAAAAIATQPEPSPLRR